MSKRKSGFVPLKSYKPITNERQARKATSEFHHGQGDRTQYQAASALLTNIHKTSSKFVFRSITKLGRRPSAKEPRLKTLEIGAVNTQLLDSPFLDVLAIDVKSRHPLIKEQDFFTTIPQGEYDAVVLAMVLNCVTTATARGKMLKMCMKHLKPGGLFFLILPTRCFPDDTLSEFDETVAVPLGFEILDREATSKVVFTCYRLANVVEDEGDMTVSFHTSNGLLDVVMGERDAIAENSNKRRKSST